MGHGRALVWPGLNADASALSFLTTATSAEVAAEPGLLTPQTPAPRELSLSRCQCGAHGHFICPSYIFGLSGTATATFSRLSECQCGARGHVVAQTYSFGFRGRATPPFGLPPDGLLETAPDALMLAVLSDILAACLWKLECWMCKKSECDEGGGCQRKNSSEPICDGPKAADNQLSV